MSSVYNLYLIDEEKIPEKLKGTLEEKYNQLIELVTQIGIFYETIEMREFDFIMAIEAVDWLIGKTQILPVFTFNNSPHGLLLDETDKTGDNRVFGYFNSEQVEDLYDCIKFYENFDIFSDEGDLMLEHNQDVDIDAFEDVLNAYVSVLKKAFDTGYSIAIIHN